MNNKYFNKLSFRDKINNYRQSTRFIISQVQQPSIPQVVLFSESNAHYLQASRILPDSQFCITQSHRMGHSKQMEHKCKSCERKKQVNSKGLNLSMTSGKIISPKIIQIMLDKKKDIFCSNKSNSIHSFNQYQRLQSSQRERVKQYKASYDSPGGKSISRSVSSRISPRGKMNKVSHIQVINSQYSINSKQGLSKSKAYNRIFKKAPFINNNQLNVRGIFPVPIQYLQSRSK